MNRLPRLTPLYALWALALIGGCAEPLPTDEELRAIEERAGALARSLGELAEARAKGLDVRLMFEEDVDLDLYVTDPLLETVYFARHDSRTGGRIVSDVRCDAAGPRVEEVRFDEPWPGRYRIGVDFPHRCDGRQSAAPAPFAVAVFLDGRLIREARGLVEREFFEVRVLEFDVGVPEQDPAPGAQ